MLAAPLGGVAQRFEVRGQAGVEGGLPVRRLRLEPAELRRLPAVLFLVAGDVEADHVGVQAGVALAVHRPRREMHELRPGQVAGHAVLVEAALADPRLGLRLQLAHGLARGGAEGVQHPPVAGEGVEQRDALGGVEVEVVGDGAVGLLADGEPAAAVGVEVVAQAAEGLQGDGAAQAQAFGRLAAPVADQLLAVVVGLGVVGLRVGRRADLVDAEHGIGGVGDGCGSTADGTLYAPKRTGQGSKVTSQ